MGTAMTLEGNREKQALTMLKRVCSLLDSLDIPYLLEAGTLLGIMREDRLLPWDTDLDITLTATSLPAFLKHKWRLWMMGYRTRVRYFKRDTGPFKKGQIRLIKVQTTRFLFLKDQNLMDIFIKYKYGAAYEWVIDDQQPILKKAPAGYYERLRRHSFKGYDYNVPEDAEGYLAYHYGPEWRIPVKKWDFRMDDACEKIVL